MALNREQKRKLEKTGDLGDEDAPSSGRKVDGTTTKAAPAKDKEQRTSPRVFVREVRGELRKVAWPTRKETLNYSAIVAVTLIFMTALIAVLDYAFSQIVLRLFNIQ